MATLKVLFEAGKLAVGQAVHWLRKKREDERRRHFGYGKQQFLMEFITKARTANVCRLGTIPMPDTQEFGYCESLVADGVFDRDTMIGCYFLKPSGSWQDGETHRPC